MSSRYLCPHCKKCNAYNPASGLCICLEKFDVVAMPVKTDRIEKPGTLCPTYEKR